VSAPFFQNRDIGAPARRAIVARLAEGETSVTALAEPFDMSLPAVSKHIRVLERAGCSPPSPLPLAHAMANATRSMAEMTNDPH